MSLIKVWTEIYDNKFASLPAKIIHTNGDTFTIRYLSATENRDAHNRKIYAYEEETYDITNDYITEYMNSDYELDFGFKEISTGQFIKYETDSDDEDYIPSSSSYSTSSSDNDNDDDENDISDDEQDDDDDDGYGSGGSY